MTQQIFETPKEPANFQSLELIESLKRVKEEIDTVLQSAEVDVAALAGLKEKLAIECIEDLAKKYSLKFTLRYNQKQRRWSVNVMSHTFNNYDFSIAVRQAFELVLKAKGENLEE